MHKQSEIAPLETFKPNMGAYRVCKACKAPGITAYFVTFRGLDRHIAMVHSK